MSHHKSPFIALAALGIVGVLAAPAAASNAISAAAHGHRYRHGVVPLRPGAHHKGANVAAQAGLLQYGGGVAGVGVTTGAPKVYVVFWGSQWGTQSTNSQGYTTLSGDPNNAAPVIQAFFKGLGTGGESWSGVMTQYCEGIAAGSTSCPAGAAHVGYPTGGALAGVWVDGSAAAPASATGNQIGAEAVAAAAHFGNTSGASNRDVQYDIVSPTGTTPDGFNTASGEFCAWHDYTGDSTLSGGAVNSPYGNIAFTNMPYVTDAGSSCGENFVNSGAAGIGDGFTIVGGHEYAETITDQFPAGGWTDSSGAENGDKCAWISSGQGASQNITLSTGAFAVQSTWANDSGSAGGCEVSHAIVGGGEGGSGGGGCTAAQLLGNPGFETGTASSWTATSGVINNSSSEPPHSGSWDAWLDGYGAVHTDTLSQTVTIPAACTSDSLSFWLHVDTANTSAAAQDTLQVQLLNSSGAVLTTLHTYSNLDANTGYTQESFNVSPYAGQAITLKLTGSESGNGQTSFVVDDFALNVAGGSGPGNTVTVTNPGGQTATVGTATSLQIQASDSASGQTLTYGAAGLPAGLSINSSTGLISGTPSTAGSSTVTVTATDPTRAKGSTTFTWTVNPPSTGCSAAQLLGNPGFETGTASPWTASAGVINNSSAEPPHSGSWDAWLDGYGTTHTDTLSQKVTIPSNCVKATMSFWLHIDTAETSTTTAYDTLKVQILNSSGTVLSTLHTYSNLDHVTGYVQHSFDLIPYIGQTIQLKFTGTEDYEKQTSFVIDDTAINVS
ncbi:MAG TPA: putative Ig domain-containing protein [Solirubrobacteraceae bacterium]|jgi:serine protease|nr:putative Ig domain-containing protein [Solirubrobacteraceae bacterium]